jgi:hypothetical protein
MPEYQTTFANIATDTVFVYNNVEYRKMPEVRVSCCRKLNAVVVSTGEQTFIQDNATITVK